MAVEYQVKYTPGFDPTIVNVSQNDVGRQFDLKIIDETGAAQQIPSGSTVKFVGMKPSGLGFTVNCTFTNSVVHVTTTDIMTDEHGLIPAEVQITNGNTVIGTANVNLRVEKNPHPEGTIDDNLIRIIPTFEVIYQRLDILESSMYTAENNISNLQTRVGIVEVKADDAYDIGSQAATMASAHAVEIGGIKRGYDGTVYQTAGDAVRAQAFRGTDTTLSVSGKSADAKVTGDGIRYNKALNHTENCLYTNWVAGGWYYGQRSDSTARRRIDKEFYLKAGDIVTIQCDNDHRIAFGVYDMTGVTLVDDSGWIRSAQYTVESDAIVCIQAANNNTTTTFIDSTFDGEVIISYGTKSFHEQAEKDHQVLESINPDAYDEIMTINKDVMEYGTYDSGGYAAAANKNRCRNINRYIKAHYGDIVIGRYKTTTILCAVVDKTTGEILYTTGFRNGNFAIEISNDGYYVFLGGSALTSFDGSFSVFRRNYKAQPLDYYETEITTTIDSIKDAQTDPCISFPLITDIHYGNKTNSNPFLFNISFCNINYVCKKTRADCMIGLGDMQDGAFDAVNAIAYARRVNNMLRDLGVPYYMALGNHDDNRYGASKLTAAEIYKSYTSLINNKVVFLESEPSNFYVDFDNYNTRFVFINSNNNGAYGFTSAAVSWFTGTALNTDYSIVFFTHVSPVPAQNYNNLSITNNSSISNAIVSFINGGGHLLQIYGHSHCDTSFTTPYPSISIGCNKFTNENGDPTLWPSGGVMPTRTADTATEDLWDFVVLKPFSHTANFIRFGAGTDRVMTW